jgi:hypothetical protein
MPQALFRQHAATTMVSPMKSEVALWATPAHEEDAAALAPRCPPNQQNGERPKKKPRCHGDNSTTPTATVSDEGAAFGCSRGSFTVTAGPAAVDRSPPRSTTAKLAIILGQWWGRMMRSFAAFSRPNTPSFLIQDSQVWRDHIAAHPCVYAGLDGGRPQLRDHWLLSDDPRWTSHFRGASLQASSFGSLGPDPTGLFYYFLLKGATNPLEPAAWLIVMALVDKLYLEHYTLFNSLAAAPGRSTVREAGIAAFGVRFFTGHALRNLFVLFALVHKWHGEYYFTLKYFVDLLPSGLGRPTTSARVAGPNQLVPRAIAASFRPQCIGPVEPVELAAVEEGFLRLLGYNLSVAPQSILRLTDYFLSCDEKLLVVDYVAKNSVQKKFTVVM